MDRVGEKLKRKKDSQIFPHLKNDQNQYFLWGCIIDEMIDWILFDNNYIIQQLSVRPYS